MKITLGKILLETRTSPWRQALQAKVSGMLPGIELCTRLP
jgi:hypothetical protein